MTKTLPERAQKVFTANVPFQPVAMERGEGCWIYDTDGNKYLDFAAGIAVASLGHATPVITKALQEQSEKFLICPASYVSKPRVELAELLIENCCCDKAFFCNSGTEAIEAAIKLARKWAHKNKSETCKDFIAFKQSFHGRTMGASSLTAKAEKQPEFGPYIPGVSFAEFNNLDSLKALIHDNICGIVVEPVQGEGGVTPATQEFMQGLRALCDEHQIVLILDEIQCGIGRVGRLYAHSHYGIKADILTLAKGMGSGFPVGAMLAREPFASAFEAGDHGTTYGGNALACAVSLAVVNETISPDFLEHVLDVGDHMRVGLEEIAAKSNKINEVRGLGLMLGADMAVPIKNVLTGLRENRLLATQAGASTLRLTPPLIVTKEECDIALETIEKTLRDL